MNHRALTAAESAALSSLSSPTTPPLRLVHSRTELEDLVCAIARTRRAQRATQRTRAELISELRTSDAYAIDLREREAQQMQALDTYINTLAGL